MRYVGHTGTDAELAGMCVDLFEGNLRENLPSTRRIKDNIGMLKGKNLACWCKPGAPCHADVLLKMANAMEWSQMP